MSTPGWAQGFLQLAATPGFWAICLRGGSGDRPSSLQSYTGIIQEQQVGGNREAERRQGTGLREQRER